MELVWAYGNRTLLMRLYKKSYYILFCICLFATCFAKPLPKIKIKQNKERVIAEYLKVHKSFSRQMCSNGEDHKYNKLMKEYRGAGYYIPVVKDHLDIDAISKHIPLIEQKILWISDQRKELRKEKSFKSQLALIKSIRRRLTKILNIKEHFFSTTDRKKRDLHLINSEKELKKLKRSFLKLTTKIAFLKSFKFPVNHFNLRKGYDKVKDLEDEENKRLSNSIYFLRRVLQDGAQDPGNKRSDRFLRANLDNVFLKFQEAGGLISEDLRYDLNSLLNGIERQLKRGRKKIAKRLNEWKKRTEKTLAFYESLIEKQGGKQVETEKSKELLKKKSKSTFALKDYTLSQQEKVYKFWHKQPELMKALFVIETILFNEVGGVDGRSGLERMDVTQVVLNRHDMEVYNSMDSKKDTLMPYLLKTFEEKQIQNEKWLNTLFKTGEFSFTYYFIGGSVHIYCPDMSRAGRFLRKENLNLAIRILRKPLNHFRATRYFSRHSMLGRVNMAFLWEGFEAYPERPGKLAYDLRSLRNAYKKNNYTFLYSFMDPQGRLFDVVEIKKKAYALKKNVKGYLFYEHRNPHYFRYFKHFENSL